MQILNNHMYPHHHHQFIRFSANFKRKLFLPVYHPLVTGTRNRLFISSCASKKNDEAVVCKDAEVLPKVGNEDAIVSSKKDDGIDHLGALAKAIAKAIATSGPVYDAAKKAFGPFLAVVAPLISFLLDHLPPLKPLIFIKKEEKTNFILVGDLVRFPHNGKHTVGLVSYFGDTKTVIQLVDGEVELHDTDFVRSKVYNITMSTSNETLWGIHLELLCEENCDRENVTTEIKKILKSCKLIKSNFHLVTVASRNPLKISIICHVKREKLKHPYLLRYANLKYDLEEKIEKLGVICE